MKCKIKSITDLDGTPKTDGRYPQRTGSIVQIHEEYTTVGVPLMIHYISDEEGNLKEGCLRTSSIERMTMVDTEFTVTTRNSIYCFERLR